jgi:type II secretory pathway pseudopilin PulG
MKKIKGEKGSLLLEALVSLGLLGIVAISIVGATTNINVGWNKLKVATDAYDTIYSTYQILRGLNSTIWLDNHLGENILPQFESKYGSSTTFGLDFSNIDSITVNGYNQKEITDNTGNIILKYYTYYIVNYVLKNPTKTIKLPLTINYITPVKSGK